MIPLLVNKFPKYELYNKTHSLIYNILNRLNRYSKCFNLGLESLLKLKPKKP